MAGILSNGRRRLLAGLIAAGIAGPSALAQPASSLPKCDRRRSGSEDYLGEGYRAFIYDHGPSASALVPSKETGSVPGFTRGKFGIKLAADSDENGEAVRLTLRLEGARPDSIALIGEMQFSVTINGRRAALLFKAHSSGSFVQFTGLQTLLPRTFQNLSRDIEVGIYLPGTPLSGPPTFVRTYDRARIAAATRLAMTELAELRARHQRGECQTIPLGCFLTTAAVDMLNLADDCWELRTLRRFRAGWRSSRAGRSLLRNITSARPRLQRNCTMIGLGSQGSI